MIEPRDIAIYHYTDGMRKQHRFTVTHKPTGISVSAQSRTRALELLAKQLEITNAAQKAQNAT